MALATATYFTLLWLEAVSSLTSQVFKNTFFSLNSYCSFLPSLQFSIWINMDHVSKDSQANHCQVHINSQDMHRYQGCDWARAQHGHTITNIQVGRLVLKSSSLSYMMNFSRPNTRI
ncbi:hypothetical protein H5410_035798 [Solanum commersonii]|uniref:Uncharacterized protein n=1 Tax=Solanum commersonii TaxID=4109 RepID=A0A9J5Y690_SOLCO|nr:hypothetical protein H5410_035798 [Solanum commersonii]